MPDSVAPLWNPGSYEGYGSTPLNQAPLAHSLLCHCPMSDGRDTEPGRPRVAPIFIFADDDGAALNALMMGINAQWLSVPVSKPSQVLRYAKDFATTAVFVAEGLDFSKDGGVERLIQYLLDEVGKPVVILSESWSLEVAERWRRLGAQDCIPHPTRTRERFVRLNEKLRELVLATAGKQADAQG